MSAIFGLQEVVKIQLLSRKQFCRALERILSEREGAIVKIRLVELEEVENEYSDSTRVIEEEPILG